MGSTITLPPAKSPLYLRIPVGAVIALRLGSLTSLARNPMMATQSLLLVNVLLLGLAIIALLGIWSMKRWGVFLFALLSTAHLLGGTSVGTTWRAPAGAAVYGLLALVPSALCWRRMAWR